MSTTTTSAIAAAPRSLRSRIFNHPFTRAVLAVLCVQVPFFAVLILTGMLPKPYRQGWPMLLAALAIVAGYRLYVRKLERREMAELALRGAGRELGQGV